MGDAWEVDGWVDGEGGGGRTTISLGVIDGDVGESLARCWFVCFVG